MLSISDPVASTFEPASILVYKEIAPSTTYLHPLGADSTADALYVFSEGLSPRLVSVRRGQRGANAHVGKIELEQGLSRVVKGAGTVKFSGGVETPANAWVRPARGTQGPRSRRVVIAGEEYLWMERVYVGGQFVHLLTKDGATVATFVPANTTRLQGSMDRHMMRAYIAFRGARRPVQRVLDEIVLSLLVIQQRSKLAGEDDWAYWGAFTLGAGARLDGESAKPIAQGLSRASVAVGHVARSGVLVAKMGVSRALDHSSRARVSSVLGYAAKAGGSAAILQARRCTIWCQERGKKWQWKLQ